MSQYQRLTFEDHGDVTVVRCVDSRIQDQALIRQWTDELNDLVIQQEKHKLVMNLSNVQFLASAALNKLVVLNRQLRKLGGAFVLAEIQGPIRDMFSVTNLDKVLPLAESESEAIAMCTDAN